MSEFTQRGSGREAARDWGRGGELVYKGTGFRSGDLETDRGWAWLLHSVNVLNATGSTLKNG